ncbi:hypothetical protein CDAR_563151 [Caerostris darwini]|uniref:Secreted protein n=1 Tax=Caerostris darwini TaxID=1538125 RepID=A0AAV4T3E5_9ARAC|nr:hypothetical protein CDAR_563151 [Caerostris darwini]
MGNVIMVAYQMLMLGGILTSSQMHSCGFRESEEAKDLKKNDNYLKILISCKISALSFCHPSPIRDTYAAFIKSLDFGSWLPLSREV